jgi:hypothetical protein
MKDLTEYIDLILQELNIPLTVSIINETYFIVFNIKDIRYDNEIVKNLIKAEVDNVINRYIPEGTINYLININVSRY